MQKRNRMLAWTLCVVAESVIWMVLIPAAATVALVGGVVVYLAAEKQ